MKNKRSIFLISVLIVLFVGCGTSKNFNKETRYNSESDTKPYIEPFQVNQDLFKAAYKGYLSRVRLLIKRGNDINAKDESGETVLHIASGTGHWEMVEFLLNHGADVNIQNEMGQTPLLLLVDNYSIG